MKNKDIRKILFVCGLVSVFVMQSCDNSRVKTDLSVDKTSDVIDTMKLNLNFTSVDSLKIIYTTNEEAEVLVDKEDLKDQIGQRLSLFVNDTAWNNSGIMVKMVAPDYMLVLHHLGKSGVDNKWISIWKELGKAKVENKWYLLPENKEDLFLLLDNQKK